MMRLVRQLALCPESAKGLQINIEGGKITFTADSAAGAVASLTSRQQSRLLLRLILPLETLK